MEPIAPTGPIFRECVLWTLPHKSGVAILKFFDFSDFMAVFIGSGRAKKSIFENFTSFLDLKTVKSNLKEIPTPLLKGASHGTNSRKMGPIGVMVFTR